MDALLYAFSLGFSGSDMIRAVVLMMIGAFVVTKQFSASKVTAVLLLIDTAWPYGAMLLADGSHKGVEIALRGAIMHWDDYLAGFLVRAAGFYVFIRGSYSVRRKLHESFGEGDSGGAKLLPF